MEDALYFGRASPHPEFPGGAPRTMRTYFLLIAALILPLLAASRLSAQAFPPPAGLSSSGLCGLSSLGYPLCPELVTVSATGGYGYTESTGPIAGAHHRLAGSVAAGVVPLAWLALALRLDGRIDLHPADERGDDYTGTGEPRLLMRAGRKLSDALALGGEAVVWVPGNDAPSFALDATTVDLKALLSYRPAKWPVDMLAHAGMRIDQSANSAPEVRRLRAGDRLSLGVSDSHAILLALGVTTRAVALSELFAELSLDWLVGDKAPSFAQSPMRATLGARRFFSRSLQGELAATIALSGRPKVDLDAPLVPIEPRLSISLGVRYGFDLRPPRPTQKPTVKVDVPQAPTTARVSGLLVDDAGQPLPDVRVTLERGSQSREAITDGEGRYTFEHVPVGRASLEAAAPGFETQKWELEVGADMPPEAKRPLVARGNVGSLRVLTRSFTSEPLQAGILVRDTRGKKAASGETSEQGLFEVDLPPGRYVMTITAPGYRPLQREVHIERYGVAILNVDMREEK
jgi:hypothetical protein